MIQGPVVNDESLEPVNTLVVSAYRNNQPDERVDMAGDLLKNVMARIKERGGVRWCEVDEFENLWCVVNTEELNEFLIMLGVCPGPLLGLAPAPARCLLGLAPACPVLYNILITNKTFTFKLIIN